MNNGTENRPMIGQVMDDENELLRAALRALKSGQCIEAIDIYSRVGIRPRSILRSACRYCVYSRVTWRFACGPSRVELSLMSA